MPFLPIEIWAWHNWHDHAFKRLFLHESFFKGVRSLEYLSFQQWFVLHNSGRPLNVEIWALMISEKARNFHLSRKPLNCLDQISILFQTWSISNVQIFSGIFAIKFCYRCILFSFSPLLSGKPFFFHLCCYLLPKFCHRLDNFMTFESLRFLKMKLI